MSEKYAGPARSLELYLAALAAVSGLERKGATMPYTSHNGWMFSFLDADGAVSLRLSPEDRSEFLEISGARATVQHGRELKDFVVVPKALLENNVELAPWLIRSYEWIATLKPKSPNASG